MIAPHNRLLYSMGYKKILCLNCVENLLIVKSFLQDTKSEVEAKKLIKCIIKIVIKLGILYSNEKLSPNEKMLLKQMIRNFSKLIMTLVTFWEVREFRIYMFSFSWFYFQLLVLVMRENIKFIVSKIHKFLIFLEIRCDDAGIIIYYLLFIIYYLLFIIYSCRNY